MRAQRLVKSFRKSPAAHSETEEISTFGDRYVVCRIKRPRRAGPVTFGALTSCGSATVK